MYGVIINDTQKYTLQVYHTYEQKLDICGY